jgi:GNAT superfamily N-acetyltransferase
VARAFENQLARTLPVGVDGGADLFAVPTDVSVTPVGSGQDDEDWLDTVAQGFAAAAGGDAADQDTVLRVRGFMRAFDHPTMTRYLARAEQTPVAGGAMYISNSVAGLTGTATIPSHRGRGIQHAVVSRMLRDAAGGADLAMATTDPGSRSQRTFERFGFQVIYTRTVFVRTFNSR